MRVRGSENDGRSGGRQASCVREGRQEQGLRAILLFSTVAGVAGVGLGTERFSERFLSRGPAAWKRMRIRVLRDVAWRPIMKAGTNVPSYSGGLAAA